MARSPIEAARLEAIAAAKQLHRQLDMPRRVIQGESQIDVFEAIIELGIPLVFKPLKTALGLCLPAPVRGIMVTTLRGLHVQRFTAAHELGHAVLEHQGSIDLEILERGPLPPPRGRDLREVSADAFAAEFLLPRWLYKHHVQAQSWTVNGHLRNPEIVYQLSLRMGTSYEATCWGLVSHQILPQHEVETLLASKVAKLKKRFSGEFDLENSWSDVWSLTKRDNGTQLRGNPDDLIRIELEEAAGTGHQWQANALLEAGYQILSDQTEFSRDPLFYGAPSHRILVARPPASGNSSVTLHERQPWSENSSEDETFSISLALDGPEKGGLSRADRRRLGKQS